MSTHTSLPLGLLLLAFALCALAVPTSGQRSKPGLPIPGGARVTLELDKPRCFLGENVLAHFRLENVGDKPFSYSYGSDYQGSSRSLRFKVTAVGPDGKPVTDPDPSGFTLGGLGGSTDMKPGQHVYWSLPLIRYCLLDKPGRYTLRVHHDFGWTETPERKFPQGEAVITLIMPTPAQARQVLQNMDEPPAPNTRGWGEKSAPYPDFSALHYPVYLPLLRERARSGAPKAFETALQSIGSIPTPQATQALLEMVDDPDTGHAVAALLTLNARLPDPASRGKLLHRSPFQDPTATPRLSLSHSAWRPRFAPSVRAHARRLLLSPDTTAVGAAAFALECVGTAEDLPSLTSALDTAIQKAPSVPVFEGYYPRSYGACAELERATLARIQEGARVPTAPRTPAEQDEYLQALTAQPPQRPSDWPARCLNLLDSPVAYLRARTLATLVTLLPLPPSLAASVQGRLPALLLDPNKDIQVAASDMAMRIKDDTLRAPVLQALAQARDFPLPNNLTGAAIFQGARWEALKFWADHLDDPARKQEALQYLTYLVAPQRSYGSDSNFDAATGTALKAEWDEFLLAHRQEIQDGKTYSLTDPGVQALYPKQIFMFGGGSF